MPSDDLDDLLDEIDGMLKDDQQRPTMTAVGSSRHGNPAACSGDDIDSLLADLDATNGSRPHAPALSCAPLPQMSAADGISGSTESGDTSTNLRCTSCDFRVMRFSDAEWQSDVDYMFLRNFMPNEAKLRPKLKAKNGYAAFACQCSWATIELGERMPNPKWFSC